MNSRKDIQLTAKHVAYIAVMTALLIGGQVALGFVAGIEVVTVLLASFAFVFGILDGVLVAVAFSLLRCFIWGFYPTVIVLYLVYYPLFALVFGLMGKWVNKLKTPSVGLILAFHAVLLLIVAGGASCFIFHLIKISPRYRGVINALIITSMILCFLLMVAFDSLHIIKKAKNKDYSTLLQLILLTGVATFCTVCFTLLDDVISPLMLGMTAKGAYVYFINSFTAMLPQTVCTITTMITLFYPLTKIMKNIHKSV